MKGFILCAGKGTRFYPYTKNRPKPSIPFLYQPLFTYSAMTLLEYAGVNQIGINTFEFPKVLHRQIEELPPAFSSVDWHIQSDGKFLLETGGGIANAHSYLKAQENFWVLNGDSIFIPQNKEVLPKMLSLHKEKKSLSTLLVQKPTAQATSFVWTTKELEVLSFGKEASRPDLIPWEFLGVRILSSGIFKYLPNTPHSMVTSWREAISKGEKLIVYPQERGVFLEIGSVEQYFQGNEFLFKQWKQDPFTSYYSCFYKDLSPPHLLTSPSLQKKYWILSQNKRTAKEFSQCKISGSLILDSSVKIKKGSYHNVVIEKQKIWEKNIFIQRFLNLKNKLFLRI